jgi:hypothetical protein
VDICISFHPITLGTCTSVVRLFVAEHNFKPIETVINARAVSGMIEQRALQQAEERISTLLSNKTFDISQRFGETSFGATATLSPPESHTDREVSPRTSKLKSKFDTSHQSGSNGAADPVAAVLKKTFAADGVEPTLKMALLKPNENGTLLLGSKVATLVESGPLKGAKKLIGNLQSTQPLLARGVGSGNVFDTGAEFISSQARLHHTLHPAQNSKSSKSFATDKIVEGLRVPLNLNSTAAVNSVLTQEPGKLKPKDLKSAIERNREERRKQEQEQARLREEGGGGIGRGLDLRAILADEKLNCDSGDVFKRQLREMAFLADMEETKKEEAEKSFRVSEEFLGAAILSSEDLKAIQRQRQIYRQHTNRTSWRDRVSRMETVSFSAESEEVRAGAPTPPIQFPQNLLANSSSVILEATPPSFDSNKNDVWAKRMNTLRKFISVAGKWIVQRRIAKRLEMLKHRLSAAGVVDRQSARDFVSADTAAPSSTTANAHTIPKSFETGPQSHLAPTNSLASLVCSLPNQALERKKHAESLSESFVPTAEMCRRIAFPKNVVDETAARKPMTAASVDDPLSFDDRTFFPLKVRTEFIDLAYEREPTPLCPVYFRPMSKLNLRPLQGASEEKSVRSSAGSCYTRADLEFLLHSGSDQVFAPTTYSSPPFEHETPETPLAMEQELFTDSLPPLWLTTNASSSSNSVGLTLECDLCLTRPDYRVFNPTISLKESDADWVLRPTCEKYNYDFDPTLRTRSAASQTSSLPSGCSPDPALDRRKHICSGITQAGALILPRLPAPPSPSSISQMQTCMARASAAPLPIIRNRSISETLISCLFKPNSHGKII